MHFTSIILVALFAIARADFPLDIQELIFRNNTEDNAEVYRLPEDLDPIHYEVEITPYFNATETKEAFTFDGRVKLTVMAVKPDINALIIQENVREIEALSVIDENGVPLRLSPFKPFERLRQYHFLKVNLDDGVTLVNGSIYNMTIYYIGNINETPLSRGVFRGKHKDSNGIDRWYLATHLQPTNSRQAFPSFDEPGFKSTFDIIINRPAHFADTYSNMNISQKTTVGDRVKEIFQTTPKMSAYLVTFHVSEDFTVIADNENEEKSYRILARSTAQGQGQYALEVGPPLSDWLSKYFNIEYYDMELNIKNDQIASPFWASGATENWGLVTYREVRLLYEEGETNALDKMYIGTITAHELAHKWFGNLITCRWWDNVWINEGFASYFEYFAMDGVDKSLELEKQFNIMYVQSALSTDSAVNTRALQYTVNSPTQVTSHFSGISYSKGASLLLMLKHLVTEDTFKKALNYFLVERSYKHAFPSHLYSAFAKAVLEDGVPSTDFNITGFMQYWVDEPGYPVLTVNTSQGVISLEQERFYINPPTESSDQVWPLPLTFTTESETNWENLQPSKVLWTKTDTIEKDVRNEWIIFNVKQKGIYRVNYEPHNWQKIANTLNGNVSTIDELNRAQIVDDVFALMRSGRLSYELGYQVIDFLKKDPSYYVWYPAVTGFSWLRNRFLHLPEELAAFDRILYAYLEHVISQVGYEVDRNEPLPWTLNRFFVLSFACNIGHQGCVEDAVQKFKALVDNGTSVDPNLRRHVFCEGLRAGGLDEWKFLYERRKKSNNQADEVAMLRALGCTSNDEARELFLEMVLNDDDVKAQDRVNAFTWFYMGNRDNSKVALQFFKENGNIDRIREAVVLPAWFNSVLSGIAGYLDEEGLQDMEQWLNANQESIPEYIVGLNAISSARSNMQWGTDRADMIIQAAQQQSFSQQQ